MWGIAILSAAALASSDCCIAVVDDTKDAGSCWTNKPGEGWTNHGYLSQAECEQHCADAACEDSSGDKGDSSGDKEDYSGDKGDYSGDKGDYSGDKEADYSGDKEGDYSGDKEGDYSGDKDGDHSGDKGGDYSGDKGGDSSKDGDAEGEKGSQDANGCDAHKTQSACAGQAGCVWYADYTVCWSDDGKSDDGEAGSKEEDSSEEGDSKDGDSSKEGEKEGEKGSDDANGCDAHKTESACAGQAGCVWYAEYTMCWSDEGKEDGKEGDKEGDWSDKEGKEGESKSKSASSQGQEYEIQYVWEGVTMTRSYSMVLPPANAQRCGAPTGLVVALHGAGGHGRWECGYGDKMALPENQGVILACPSGRGGAWKAFSNEGDDDEDVTFIAAVIEHLNSVYNIPEGRTILTGFSLGVSMSYRVGCERSDLLGGLVQYGMNWMEPAAGHMPKGTPGDPTDHALGESARVRQNGQGCSPEFKVPHYQAVGLEDVYASETRGAYNSKKLWMDYSTNVLGCLGEPVELGMPVHPQSTCWGYISCPAMSARVPGKDPEDMNVYCAVDDMGHETQFQGRFIAQAYEDFFGSLTCSDVEASALGFLEPIKVPGTSVSSTPAAFSAAALLAFLFQ